MEVPESYPEGVPISIRYPKIPVYAFLENSARKFPNRDALIFHGSNIKYSDLGEYSLRFAKALRDLGFRKGERVALLLPNVPQFIIAYYGILAAGGIFVTINPLMTDNEIKRQLRITGCNTLVVLDRLLYKIPDHESVKLIVAKVAAFTPFYIRFLSKLKYNVKLPEDALLFEDLLKSTPLEETVRVDAKHDVAGILFTSGTTGTPKGVMLTHYNLVANALQSYHWLRGWGYSAKPQLKGWPIVLCALPFFHSYGMVVLNESIQFGCTLVMLPEPTARKIMIATDKYNVTHFPLIPRFIRDILNHPELTRYNLKSITSCATGGANIPEEHMRKFEKVAAARFYQGYGLTEAGPSTHATPIEGEPKYDSVGLAYPDTETKIVDLQTGANELPRGQIGEISIKGPQIMKGYWRNPKITADVLKDGWLYTGDIGHIDDEGYLYVIGRKKERIIARGHTIWPKEVETVLKDHPKVEDAIAIGVPDPLRCSTDIRALVIPKKEPTSDEFEDRLINYCKDHLEPYQVPAKINFFDSLPRTVMGKIDRLKIETMISKQIQENVEKSIEKLGMDTLREKIEK